MKFTIRLSKTAATAAFVALTAGASAMSAEPASHLGSACNNPPRVSCPKANCVPELMGVPGEAVEPKSGRKFFLEYPCDLKRGEKVVFVLSLHGAGSIGNWQRHYFPLTDLKDKYRLVVATPTALNAQPTRTWQPAADDKFLQDLTDAVIRDFGRQNIKAFWMAGHSQGGITTRRIICSDFFRNKVDGFLNLSGGRISAPNPNAPARAAAAPAPARAAPARPAAAPGAAPAPARAAQAAPAPLNCEFSFIYGTGALEATGLALPTTSPWADRYHCGARVRQPDVVDTREGYVTATDQSRGPSWGRFARPGTANVFVFPNCDGGRIVADVNRLDKGHTEGYEPNITEAMIKLMLSAPGGKLQRTRG